MEAVESTRVESACVESEAVESTRVESEAVESEVVESVVEVSAGVVSSKDVSDSVESNNVVSNKVVSSWVVSEIVSVRVSTIVSRVGFEAVSAIVSIGDLGDLVVSVATFVESSLAAVRKKKTRKRPVACFSIVFMIPIISE